MTDLALPFTLDALDALAQALAPRIAEINREREDDRFLGYAASADFLGMTVKAVQRMREKGILVPDGWNGRNPLFLKSTLRAAVQR